METTNIARKILIINASNLIIGLLNYVSLFVITRYYNFPKFVLGLLNFAVGFVAVYSVFANLGFPAAHSKRISEGRNLARCISTYFLIRTILILLMVVAVILSIAIWKNVLHRGFETPEQERAVYVMLCYYVILLFSQNITHTYRAKTEIVIAQMPYILEAIVRTSATIYFVFLQMDAIWIVSTYVIGSLALILSAIAFFRGPISKPTMEDIHSYIKFALPMSISSASLIIMTNLDKVLIQLFWGYNEGADYFSIVRLSRFLNNISIAVGMLLLPILSAMHARKQTGKIKGIVISTERYISMILTPIVFMMIFLAKPIIHILLSNRFYTAVPILQILPLFVLLDALSKPYTMNLAGMDLPKFVRNKAIIMILVNLFLNIILIPKDIRSIGVKLFGLAGVGAAIATVIAYFAGLLYTRIVAYRLSGMGVNTSVLKHISAALITGVAVKYISALYAIERWYNLLFIVAIGIVIYLCILVMMKEFNKRDFDFFVDLVSLKKLMVYVKTEIHKK